MTNPTYDPVTIAFLVDARLAELNYTRKHFAALVGQEMYMVNKWLSGEYNFKAHHVALIEEKLGITLQTNNTEEQCTQ